jgi:hypothetical protein
MINAWSLLYEELNGTMDKTYPIENNELNNDDINITTETGDTVYNVPDDVEIDEDIPEVVTVGSGVKGGTDEDVLNITGGDTLNFDDYPSAFTAFADNDDSIAHHIDLGIGSTASYESLNLDFSSCYGDDTISFDAPTPGIEKDCTRKYKEDESIEALKNYISTTYGGHYTSDNNNVQTLDLIESVGDAESFCRSNAIKYLSRYDKKGQAKRDILKALHYSLLLYHFSGQLNETPTRGYETF